VITRRRARLVVTGAALTTLAASTAGAFADSSSSVPVTTVVVTGTRTLTVTDPTGASIGANGLPLGAGHGGALLVNVTDTNYKNAGYQVSATMTNLYPWSAGAFDFNGTAIPSGAISVSYPAGLLDLVDVKSLVSPVVKLTGTITLGAVPLPISISQTVDGAVTTAQSLADTVTKSTLASVLTQLPVTLQTSHPNPTSLNLMSGNAQQPVASALVSALNAAYGGDTVQQLLTAGLLDQNAVVSAVAQQAGITPDMITNAERTAIMTSLTGTIDSLSGSIVGQSGSYNTMPALSINVPASAAAGTYRGQLVVTLMDK
jgi:hypothetical protein